MNPVSMTHTSIYTLDCLVIFLTRIYTLQQPLSPKGIVPFKSSSPYFTLTPFPSWVFNFPPTVLTCAGHFVQVMEIIASEEERGQLFRKGLLVRLCERGRTDGMTAH